MVYKYLNWVSIDQNEIQYYVPMSPNHVDIVGKTQPNINLLAEFDVHTHPPPLIGTQYQQYFGCYSTYLDQKFRGNTIFNKVTTVPVTFVHLFWTTKLIGPKKILIPICFWTQNLFWTQIIFCTQLFRNSKKWRDIVLEQKSIGPTYIYLDLKYLLGLTHLKYT